MSFSACIHHGGFIVFHDREPIDYELLDREVGWGLRSLLQRKIPIDDADLLKRTQNSKASEGANKKSFPRLKDKHLPAIRRIMLREVVNCKLNPKVIVCLDQYGGCNDCNEVPDLAPDYEFWMLYIKAQNPLVDFKRLQAIEKLRYQENKARLAAAAAQIDFAGSSGMGGLVKTVTASKKIKGLTARAYELQEKRIALETELDVDQGLHSKLTDETEESKAPVTSEGELPFHAVSENTNISETDTAATPTKPPIPYVPPKPSVYVPPVLVSNAVQVVIPVVPAARAPHAPDVQSTVSSTSSMDGGTTLSSNGVSSSPLFTVPANSVADAAPRWHSTTTTVTPIARPAERQRRKDILVTCKTKFKSFTDKLNSLVAALKKEQEASKQHRAARSEVVGQITEWTKETPLFAFTGGTAPATTYATVQAELNRMTTLSEEQYAASIVNSAVQWEDSVASEFKALVNESRDARQSLERNERKVETLLAQRARAEATNKLFSAAAREKLMRSEEKFTAANQKYQKCEEKLMLCVSSVEWSWLALYPLVAQLFRLEMGDAQERANVKLQLRDVLGRMSEVVEQTGLSPDLSNSQEVWQSLSVFGPPTFSSHSAPPAATANTVPSTICSSNPMPISTQNTQQSENENDWKKLKEVIKDTLLKDLEKKKKPEKSSTCNDEENAEASTPSTENESKDEELNANIVDGPKDEEPGISSELGTSGGEADLTPECADEGSFGAVTEDNDFSGEAQACDDFPSEHLSPPCFEDQEALHSALAYECEGSATAGFGNVAGFADAEGLGITEGFDDNIGGGVGEEGAAVVAHVIGGFFGWSSGD